MTIPPKISQLCQGSDNNFNLIRIISAWGVLFAHSYVLVAQKPNLIDPLQWYFGIGMGTFFVTVFFSISGFLIYRSLDRSQSLTKYFWARSKRILPALSAVLLLTVFVLGPLTTQLNTTSYFTSKETWSYLLNINLLDIHTQFQLPGVFTHNPHPSSVNGSLWTLPVETWMYVMTAVAFCLGHLLNHYLRHSNKPIFTITLISLGCVACIKAEHYLNTQQADKYSMLLFACTFIAGSLLYKLRHVTPISWLVSFILLSAIPLASDTIIFPLYFSFTLAYVVLTLAYLPKGPIRYYNRIGDYSYGLYIYAFPVQQTLVMSLPDISFMTMLLMSTILSLLCAALSWHYIESPILYSRMKAKSDH
ncbi:acyltransferase family protein [Marinomonas gallaica]|uniref:acyltransferase family protein n=1 Tax=Marinomonas gallaica TaxID=1806667 RepID=UPI003A940A84